MSVSRIVFEVRVPAQQGSSERVVFCATREIAKDVIFMFGLEGAAQLKDRATLVRQDGEYLLGDDRQPRRIHVLDREMLYWLSRTVALVFEGICAICSGVYSGRTE